MRQIGILAVQGAFAEHREKLRLMDTESFEIRKLSDLRRPIDGLILPGGESTVMGKLLRELGLLEPIREAIQGGLPVLGTCAGMILLAKEIAGGEAAHLSTMDITVMRNAYGRQLGSFHAVSSFDGRDIPMTFIRAPYIRSAGENVRVLSAVEGKIVAAQQGNQLAVAFHPELTGDTAVHRHFLNLIG